MKNNRISMIVAVILICMSSCKADDTVATGNNENVASKPLTLTPFGKLNQGNMEINSHASDWQRSILTMNYRSYFRAGVGITGTSNPHYSRVLKLADGSYILLNQNGADQHGNGSDVYWATSPDMENWTSKGKLFASHGIINGLGNPDQKWYTNGSGKVLRNGDVLLFASYRAVSTYGNYNCRYDHGIEMIRSTDNGKTWSSPQVIHRGPNWEAIMLELPSGELQCYFSESRPWISGSHSGTSMVNSVDNGVTWSPSVNNADPYRVIRHTWYSELQDKTFFTDQMPSIIQLNNSNQFVGAFESCYEYTAEGKHFKIAFAWSPMDGKWDYLAGDEGNGSNFDVSAASVGPTERALDLWRGAGPDLKQFPSGETLVSYTPTTPQLFIRIGDSQARQWGEPFLSLPGQGSWGAMTMDGSHEVITVMRNSKESNNITIDMAKWALNHSIKASNRKITLDGDNKEWLDTDEALFVGSKSQAQATLRCAVDASNIYFLIESFDNNLSKDDYVQLFLSPFNQNSLSNNSLRVSVGLQGVKNQGTYAGNWIEKDVGIEAFVSYDGTLSMSNDTDNGWLTEIAVPRSSIKINDGKILVNFSLFDIEGGEDALIDTGNRDTQKWIIISGLDNI